MPAVPVTPSTDSPGSGSAHQAASASVTALRTSPGRRPAEGPDPAGIGALLAKSPGSIFQDCSDPVKNTQYRSSKICSDAR